MAAPIVVACTAFVTDLNGTPVAVREGQRERADSALVQVSSSLWVDGSRDETEIASLAAQRRVELWPAV